MDSNITIQVKHYGLAYRAIGGWRHYGTSFLTEEEARTEIDRLKFEKENKLLSAFYKKHKKTLKIVSVISFFFID